MTMTRRLPGAIWPEPYARRALCPVQGCPYAADDQCTMPGCPGGQAKPAKGETR